MNLKPGAQLLQTEYFALNFRYPGEKLEYCCEYCCDCNQPTGCSGKGEDSRYTEDDEGPFCLECWERLGHNFVLSGLPWKDETEVKK